MIRLLAPSCGRQRPLQPLKTHFQDCNVRCRLGGPRYLHDDGAADDVVHGAVVKLLLHVEVEVVRAGADGADELGDVVGVQRAGLGGQAAGQVREAHVGHALGGEHNSAPFFTFATNKKKMLLDESSDA